MIKPDLIIRSYRRSLCLSITKEGQLVVHAPKRLNMNDIIKYIEEKEKWITTKQKEIQTKLSINKNILDYKEFLFLGKKYKIQKLQGLRKVELTENLLMVPNLEFDQVVLKIKKWYIDNENGR